MQPTSIKTESSPLHDEANFLAYPMHRLFCIVDSQAQVDAILEGLYNDEDQAAVVARFKEHGAEKVAYFKKAVVEYL